MFMQTEAEALKNKSHNIFEQQKAIERKIEAAKHKYFKSEEARQAELDKLEAELEKQKAYLVKANKKLANFWTK